MFATAPDPAAHPDWSPVLRSWVFCRYADVSAALRHPGIAVPEVLASQLYFILMMATETTPTFVGQMARWLLEHPTDRVVLAAFGATGPRLEELLRLISPVVASTRFATVPLAINGRAIREGDGMTLEYDAVNRDPEAYPEPDRLCLDRKGPPHLAFADGLHACIGAELARTEARVAL